MVISSLFLGIIIFNTYSAVKVSNAVEEIDQVPINTIQDVFDKDYQVRNILLYLKASSYAKFVCLYVRSYCMNQLRWTVYFIGELGNVLSLV